MSNDGTARLGSRRRAHAQDGPSTFHGSPTRGIPTQLDRGRPGVGPLDGAVPAFQVGTTGILEHLLDAGIPATNKKRLARTIGHGFRLRLASQGNKGTARQPPQDSPRFFPHAPGLHVAPAQYFGVALAVVGLGLVVGAWWGRARRLIPLGLLLLPLAVPAAFLTVPLTGGIGDVDFRPHNVNELRTEYRITGGDLRLDLTALDTGGEPATITASVGLGRLIVVVPDGTPLQLDAHVAWGGLNLLGNQQYGTTLADCVERPGNRTSPTGPLVLILETAIGGVSVDTAAAQGD